MRTDISPTESLTTVNCFPPGDGTGWYPYSSWRRFGEKTEEADPYLEEIKSVAAAFGYTPEDIDQLYQEGFTPEELEDALYGRELW